MRRMKNSFPFKRRMTMNIMNPGMLLFGLFDSALAFYLVYHMTRARFGGERKALARVLAAILGTIVFVVYFGVIVWFNTDTYTVSAAAKRVVYLAPIVLTVLMTALILLSQPPKKKESTDEESEEDSESEDSPSEDAP